MAEQKGGGISWTDTTWNPIRGCSRVSAGCVNCYAESTAARWSASGQPYDGLVRITPKGPAWTGKILFVEKHLDDPLRWQRPRKVFVNSMSDLFHEELDLVDIARIFGVMGAATSHTFQVLTKRAQRMREIVNLATFRKLVADEVVSAWWRKHGEGKPISSQYPHVQAPLPGDTSPRSWPLPNVWLGVSVEDQINADKRIPELLATPAAVRWLSVEPLIGRVDLSNHHASQGLDRTIDWIVVGGESGKDHRNTDVEWCSSLLYDCRRHRIPFWMKQLGGHPDARSELVDFPPELRVREFPEIAHA